MGFWQVFFSKPYFPALVFLALLQPAILFASNLLEEKLADVPPTQRLFLRLGKPLLFSLSVVVFIYLTYPAGFGLTQATTFREVLDANHKNASSLINLVFILGFLLPIIPVIGKFPGTVVALQANMGNAFVFKWMTAQSNLQSVSLLPNPAPILLLLASFWLLHILATRISLVIGDFLDRSYHYSGFSQLLSPFISILLHGPFILTYTLSLGNQLPR